MKVEKIELHLAEGIEGARGEDLYIGVIHHEGYSFKTPFASRLIEWQTDFPDVKLVIKK